jgi:hypothetical protein
MLVLVSLDAGNPRVVIADRENLNQLHVEFRGIDDASAGEGLSADGIGSIEGDHVWLDIAKLRAVGDASGGLERPLRCDGALCATQRLAR